MEVAVESNRYTQSQLIDLLVTVLVRTDETLSAAASRGTRAKPTVTELNGILDDIRATLAKVASGNKTAA